jgi:hypothetical protein
MVHTDPFGFSDRSPAYIVGLDIYFYVPPVVRQISIFPDITGTVHHHAPPPPHGNAQKSGRAPRRQGGWQ